MNRTRSDSRYLELESSSRRIVMATDPESFSVCVETNTSRPETHSPSLSLSPFSSLVIVALISQSTSPSLSFPLSFSSSISPSRSSRNNGTVEIIVSSVRSKSTPRSRVYDCTRIFLGNGLPVPNPVFTGRNERVSYSRNDRFHGQRSTEKRRETPPALSLRSSEGEVFVSFRFFSPIFFFPSGQSRTSWNVLKEIRRKRGRRGKDRRGRGRGGGERERERAPLGQTPCAYSWLPMTLEFRGAPLRLYLPGQISTLLE